MGLKLRCSIVSPVSPSTLSESVGVYRFLVGSSMSFLGRVVVLFVYIIGILVSLNTMFCVVSLEFNVLIVLWLSCICLSVVYIFVGIGVFFFYRSKYGSYREWERIVCTEGGVWDRYVYGVYIIDVNSTNKDFISQRWLLVLRLNLRFVFLLCIFFCLFGL